MMEATSKIRIGVIGAGNIGNVHIEIFNDPVLHVLISVMTKGKYYFSKFPTDIETSWSPGVSYTRANTSSRAN
jgi:predicted dehydrogenase